MTVTHAGTDDSRATSLHFFDGSSWLADTLPFFDSAAAVWGVDPHDLFVAGAQHASLHRVAP